MQTVRVQDVNAGMMAGTDICDRSGRLLISSGTLLNDAQIRILKTWGISEITISGECTAKPPQNIEVSEAHVRAAEQEIQGHFRFNTHDQPITAEFERILVLREAKEMAKQDAH